MTINRKSARIAPLIFTGLLCLSLFPVCGESTANAPETERVSDGKADVAAQAAEEEEPEGNGRSEVPDSLPPDLDFRGRGDPRVQPRRRRG